MKHYDELFDHVLRLEKYIRERRSQFFSQLTSKQYTNLNMRGLPIEKVTKSMALRQDWYSIERDIREINCLRLRLKMRVVS